MRSPGWSGHRSEESAWQAWIAGAAVLLAIGGTVFVARRGTHTTPPSSAAQRAPLFVAATLDSTPTSRTLSDYSGHPLLLNIWATWCGPCRAEMPSLERLYRDYAPKGLRIAAVSIDDPGSDQLIREFVNEHHLTFDVLHDGKAGIMTQYQIGGLPETFLISRRGDIVGTRFSADWSSPESRALVDALLRAGMR